MLICGLQKLSLLDYPNKTAATVFTGGCNFRCPFCHNAALVTQLESCEAFDEKELFVFLNKRKGLLDGVCVTGGEPLLQPDINEFLEKIKAMGFLVKLDTNGSFPDKLINVIQNGLVDYVAMDIKNSPPKYALTVGRQQVDIEKIKKSAELLKEGKIPFEFRTTVVKELHSEKDIEDIGKWLSGAENYFLQQFADSGSLITPGWHAYDASEMRKLLDVVKKYIPSAQLRGI